MIWLQNAGREAKVRHFKIDKNNPFNLSHLRYFVLGRDSLTFNVLDEKPHLIVKLINGPSESGGVAGHNTEQQNSYEICIVSQSVPLKLI